MYSAAAARTEEDQEPPRDPPQLSNEMDVQISFATLGPDGLMGGGRLPEERKGGEGGGGGRGRGGGKETWT